MSAFLNRLLVTPNPDGRTWVLLRDFIYDSSLAGTITVPVGFITDFASTPRSAWQLFPPWGKYGPAAVIHDWLYWDKPVSKDTADKVLLEAMEILGVDEVARNTIYTAVAAFGQHGWDGDGEQKAAGITHIDEDIKNGRY